MLTVKQIDSISEPGRYADRDGLYLQVTKTGTKSWVFRYKYGTKRPELGLGSIRDVSLKAAREKAAECREFLLEGFNPKVKLAELAASQSDIQKWTFERCTDEYIKTHEASWRNEKHVSQWRNTLSTYAYPVIGDTFIGDVNTDQVLQILTPIWHTKTETATRVRGRLENILSWAIVKKLHAGPNPALWRGHLSILLPAKNKIKPVKHHQALPYIRMPELMEKLRTRDSVSSKALQFTIYTALRTSESAQALWTELSLRDAMMTVPAERMKSFREHRLPLSRQAIALFDEWPMINDYLFPGLRKNRPISNMAMLKFLKTELGYPNLTVHGFRSTFRDWAAEVSEYPRELAESALAHVLQNKTEAAYQRGDLLEKRREMMQEWADYITPR